MTRAQHLLLPGGPITIGGTITVNSTSGFPRVNFNDDGTVTYTSNNIAGLFYERGWYQAANFGHEVAGIGSRYEIRLTPSVGSFGLELTSTWVALTAGTSWNRSSGNGTSTGLIEIRDATTDVVLASCTLTLSDN